MAGLFVIPFAIFFICCFAQFWFGYRVRQALVSRHPEEWLKMSGGFMFQGSVPWRFAWSGRHRDLNDPELSRKVMELRWLSVVAFGAWALIIPAALVSGVATH